MKRKEAVALLKDLGDKFLVEPLMVVVEQKEANGFQLRIKGIDNRIEIEAFLKNKGFQFEDHTDYLLISKP